LVGPGSQKAAGFTGANPALDRARRNWGLANFHARVEYQPLRKSREVSPEPRPTNH